MPGLGRSTASRWTKGGVKFIAPSVPRNFSGLSHPLPACTATIRMLLVSSGMYHSVTFYYQSFAPKVHRRRYTPDLKCMFTDWYRVEMTIANDTAEGLFNGFDWEMKTYITSVPMKLVVLIRQFQRISLSTSLSEYVLIYFQPIIDHLGWRVCEPKYVQVLN